jgi:hypothetical protein
MKGRGDTPDCVSLNDFTWELIESCSQEFSKTFPEKGLIECLRNGIGCVRTQTNNSYTAHLRALYEKKNTERELFQFLSPTERIFTWKRKKKRKINAPCSDCAMARLNHLHLWRITNVGLRLVIIIRSRETHRGRERSLLRYTEDRRILRERSHTCGPALLLYSSSRPSGSNKHTHTLYIPGWKKEEKKFLGVGLVCVLLAKWSSERNGPAAVSLGSSISRALLLCVLVHASP